MEKSRFYVLPSSAIGGVDHVDVESGRIIVCSGGGEIVVDRPLPNPRRWITTDVQHLVKLSGLTLNEIAVIINETLRISWVSAAMVYGWCMGTCWIIQDCLRVLGWLAGFHTHNLLMEPMGRYPGYYVGVR